jgi:hypothetical protein
MHTIHLSSQAYQLPSRWDELSRQQLVKIAALSGANLSAVNTSKIFFLILTLSLPWWQRLRLQFFFFLQSSIEEKGDFLLLTQSFVDFPQFSAQKVLNIGVGFVPKRKTLHAPLSKLANATLWEYILSEKYFLEYMKDRKEESLNKLIAVLYRPARKTYNPDEDEDIRVPLIDSTVQGRATQIARLPLPLRHAILMWYDGCRALIIQSFPLIFPKPKTDQNTPGGTMQFAGPKNNGGWIDLISQLSTTMSDFKKIGDTNLSIALTDISKRIQRAKETKAKTKYSRNRAAG